MQPGPISDILNGNTSKGQYKMATIYQQVDDLKKRLKVKQARIQEMEARQRSAEKKKKRRDDTRRKIMIGAAVQARVKNGENATRSPSTSGEIDRPTRPVPDPAPGSRAVRGPGATDQGRDYKLISRQRTTKATQEPLPGPACPRQSLSRLTEPDFSHAQERAEVIVQPRASQELEISGFPLAEPLLLFLT